MPITCYCGEISSKRICKYVLITPPSCLHFCKKKRTQGGAWSLYIFLHNHNYQRGAGKFIYKALILDNKQLLLYMIKGYHCTVFCITPMTVVKRKVKGQEAKIAKIKGKAWLLKESRVKGCADSIVYVNKQTNVLTVLGRTASWIQAMVSIDPTEDLEFNQQRKQTAWISKFLVTAVRNKWGDLFPI